MDKIEQLKEMMRHNVVSFKYQKKNGEIREAHGTLNLDNVPEMDQPKGTGTGSTEEYTKYYDVDKEGWRCFQNDQFIGFN